MQTLLDRPLTSKKKVSIIAWSLLILEPCFGAFHYLDVHIDVSISLLKWYEEKMDLPAKEKFVCVCFGKYPSGGFIFARVKNNRLVRPDEK